MNIIRAFVLLLTLMPFTLCSQNKEIELTNYKKIKSDSLRLDVIYKVVDHFFATNEDKFLIYNKEYKRLALNGNNHYHLGGVYRRYCNYYIKKDQLETALKYAFQALEHDLLNDDKFAIASDNTTIAQIYFELGDLDNSTKVYNNTFDYYNELQNNFPYGKGLILYKLSLIHHQKKEFTIAKKKIEKALVYLSSNKNEGEDFNKYSYREPCILNAKILSLKIHNRLKKNAKCNELIKDIEGILSNGRYYKEKQDFELYKFKFLFETQNKIDTNLIKRHIDLERQEGLYNNVIEYFEILKSFAIKRKFLNQALQYSDSIAFYRSKIYDSEKTNAISKYQVKFETRIIEYEKELANKEAKRAHQKVWLTSGLLLLSLVILVLIWLNLRNKKKTHQQKMVLKDLKINELLQKNELENLHGILSGQEIERKRIAQDLHDTIGGMLSTVKLHFNRLVISSEIKSNGLEIFNNADKLLDESCKEVRRISHDLNEGSIASYGLIENIKNLKNAIELSNSLKLDVIFENLDLKNNKQIEIEVFKIIQELISNTLKHAKANEISIQISQFEDTLQVIFEDNGIGFNVNKIKRGLGLNSIQKRTGKLKGSLEIDSHKERGSTFIFEIPL